jgi:hypothetical protein
METVVCDIAKSRMEKDFNEALQRLGLFVTSIRFDNKERLAVVLELSCDESLLNCAS